MICIHWNVILCGSKQSWSVLSHVCYPNILQEKLRKIARPANIADLETGIRNPYLPKRVRLYIWLMGLQVWLAYICKGD
jgi:hypothetical protein